VPTDVLITPAGHVLAKQTSPRTSEGYMQLIADAKQRSTVLTTEIVERSAELKEASIRARDSSPFRGEQVAGSGLNVLRPAPVTPATAANDFVPARQTQPLISSIDGQAAPELVAARAGGDFVPEAARSSGSAAESTSGETTVEAPADTAIRITNSFMPAGPRDPVALQPEMAARSNLPGPTASEAAATEPGLDGHCGVSLIEDQKWVKGDPRFGCHHRGKLYLFASKEHLDRFKMTPDMFSPVLGGADPVEFHRSGSLVDGLRKFGVFYGDEGEPTVIVLFDNQANRDAFETDPTTYLQTVRQAMAQLDAGTLIR
jgi:protein disulfide-isomerase